jgi:hypothetical protein
VLFHLGGDFGKPYTHSRGEIVHLHTLTAEADLIQQSSDVLNSAFSRYITFQVMAISFQSTGDHHAVNPSLEGVEHLPHVKLAGAGYFDNPHVGGVLESHRPSQVGGSVGAMVTAKGQNPRLKNIHCTHNALLIWQPLEPLARKRR